MNIFKSFMLVASTIVFTNCATQTAFISDSPVFDIASKANISDHAPIGHASSYYVCEEQDLNIIYNADIPIIKFQDQELPIRRVKNENVEQYSATLNGEPLLLTILDHAATLQVGEKTYKTCEKIACVPLE